MSIGGPARALALFLFSFVPMARWPWQQITAPSVYVVNFGPVDEGSDPSGFAGGKISKEYPQLSMQGLLGSDFSKTSLGFFGDEPAYSTLPWTPTLRDEFQKQKGYDPKPYIPLFFAGNPTEETQRARADFYEVRLICSSALRAGHARPLQRTLCRGEARLALGRGIRQFRRNLI